MTSRSRSLSLLAIVALPVLLVACSPDVTSPPGASSPATATPAGSTNSGEPGKPSASLHIDQPPDGEEPSPVGQSETAWGRIWDRVPAWFPRYPGSSIATDASAAPASARFAVPNGVPRDIAAWLQAALQNAQYRTDVSGPLEDGTMTLESAGNVACRMQTTVTPLGGMTFISVLYGAGCAFA